MNITTEEAMLALWTSEESLAKERYNLFYNPNPMDVTIKDMPGEDKKLKDITLPNLAKEKKKIDDFIATSNIKQTGGTIKDKENNELIFARRIKIKSNNGTGKWYKVAKKTFVDATSYAYMSVFMRFFGGGQSNSYPTHTTMDFQAKQQGMGKTQTITEVPSVNGYRGVRGGYVREGNEVIFYVRITGWVMGYVQVDANLGNEINIFEPLESVTEEPENIVYGE